MKGLLFILVAWLSSWFYNKSMARHYTFTRQEAEALVDLIEQTDQPYPLSFVAVELRQLFGMIPKEQQSVEAT